MAPARDKRRPFALVRYEATGATAPVALDARDVPAAWRRAARECRTSAFALYDADGELVRVGVPPPPALPLPHPATAVALSADGETVITGHEGGMLRAHDARSGALRWERTAGRARVDCIAVPERAGWVAACVRSGEVDVLDARSGRTLLHLADDAARSLAITPDDRTLAIGGAVVELWSLPEGQRLGALDADVALSKMERELAAESVSEGAHGAVDEADAEGCDGVVLVGFGADGRRVVGVRAHNGGELVVWDRASAQRVFARAMPSASRLALSADGARAMLAVEDDSVVVRVFDLDTLAQCAAHATCSERLRDLRATPDGAFILLQDDAIGVQVLDAATGASRAWLDDVEASAYTLGAGRPSRDERALESEWASEDTRVVALPRWRRDDPGAPLSRDGRRYAVLRRRGGESLVPLFDLVSCRPYAALSHPTAAVSVWLNHDGTLAVTRDEKGRVYLWSVPDAPPTLKGAWPE